MPEVRAVLDIPEVSPAVLWAVVGDSSRLPAIADHVLEVHPVDASGQTTAWSVLLNGSRVGWTQRETAEPPTRRSFTMVDGDLAEMGGAWTLTPTSDGVRLALRIEFELGVDGLAPLLEPSWIQSFQAYACLLVRAVAHAATATPPSQRPKQTREAV